MKRVAGFLLLAAGLCGSATNAAAQSTARDQPTPPCGPNLAVKNVEKQSRCFELRIYTMREGSAIDVMHTRFRRHADAIFKRVGIAVIGYWQPVAKPDRLVYLLAFKDAAARDAAWAAFYADPEWAQARAEGAVSADVENIFMSATDYSPLK